MYYDIYFSNPQGHIVDEPTDEQREMISQYGPGTMIEFAGINQCVVYAISERLYPPGNYPEGVTPPGLQGFMHCLVTEAQLEKMEEDHIPFDFYFNADGRFKDGGKPGHVFNPAGVLTKLNGLDTLTELDGTIVILGDDE